MILFLNTKSTILILRIGMFSNSYSSIPATKFIICSRRGILISSSNVNFFEPSWKCLDLLMIGWCLLCKMGSASIDFFFLIFLTLCNVGLLKAIEFFLGETNPILMEGIYLSLYWEWFFSGIWRWCACASYWGKCLSSAYYNNYMEFRTSL